LPLFEQLLQTVNCTPSTRTSTLSKDKRLPHISQYAKINSLILRMILSFSGNLISHVLESFKHLVPKQANVHVTQWIWLFNSQKANDAKIPKLFAQVIL
jgi:hypothetical protein